jgi:hypothetical protein
MDMNKLCGISEHSRKADKSAPTDGRMNLLISISGCLILLVGGFI